MPTGTSDGQPNQWSFQVSGIHAALADRGGAARERAGRASGLGQGTTMTESTLPYGFDTDSACGSFTQRSPSSTYLYW